MAFQGKWFNAKYYLEQNLDVANNWEGTALEHYLAWGAGENRAPNTWFDAQYYRANNPDLETMTAVELFQHYELHGYAEGRVPTALYEDFDAAAYLADYADLEPGGITLASALNHYLTFGIAEGRTAKNTNGTVITPVDSDSGSTFTLTTEIFENVVGTAANDLFNAVADVGGIAAGETFNVGDTINGGAGTDTFNLLLTSAGASIKGRTQSVEVINLIGETAAFGFGVPVDASRFAAAEQIWQINAAVAPVTNVAAGTTIGFRDVNLSVGPNFGNVVVADGVDTATIALDNVVSGSVVIVEETTANDLLTVNVSGSMAAPGVLFIDLDFSLFGLGLAAGAEETLNLALTSDGTMLIFSTTLETVDASGSTGDLTIFAPATVETLLGGSGDDVLVGGGASQLIEGGAGDDTIFAGNVAGEVIIGGAGVDNITLFAAGFAQTVVFNAGDTGLTLATIDVIVGFASGEDALAFGLADGTATNFVDGGLSSSYVDALTNANTSFDGTLQYFFSDDGTNGWLFVDRDLDGTVDEAVQLTGVLAMLAGDIVATA